MSPGVAKEARLPFSYAYLPSVRGIDCCDLLSGELDLNLLASPLSMVVSTSALMGESSFVLLMVPTPQIEGPGLAASGSPNPSAEALWRRVSRNRSTLPSFSLFIHFFAGGGPTFSYPLATHGVFCIPSLPTDIRLLLSR